MLEQLFITFQILIIDVVMAADNAIIIGLIAANFAPDNRKKIIAWGVAAAFIFRIVFATGANYITNGPEMIMVGDNPSGQERVQVTPLGGDPNINGPQGGVNVTFNNPIMTQDFVENQLIDNIKESLRLGGDIGIN